eukprot:1955545-Heterocapsa_arctica.AAC.1
MRAGEKSGEQLADFLEDFKEEINDVERQCHLLVDSPLPRRFLHILQAAVDDFYLGTLPGCSLCK